MMGKRFTIEEINKDVAYRIIPFDDVDAVCLRDNRGYIMDKEDMQKLVYKLNKTISIYDETEIEKLNKEEDLNKKEELKALQRFQKGSNSYFKNPIRNNTKGYIYFITYGEKYYKIGLTIDLDQRLSKFNVVMPFELELVHSIKSNDIYLTESLFHEYFANKRGKGEWFELDEKDINYILKGKYPKNIRDSIVGEING